MPGVGPTYPWHLVDKFVIQIIPEIMTKNASFKPSGAAHGRLTRVKGGQSNIEVDMVRLGILAEGEDIVQLSNELHAMELAALSSFSKYIIIDPPIPHGENYLIRKRLSDAGERALHCMDEGMIWDDEAHDVNVPETKQMYLKMIQSQRVEVSKILMISKNSDHRFRDIVGQLVLFKLRSVENNGFLEVCEDTSEPG